MPLTVDMLHGEGQYTDTQAQMHGPPQYFDQVLLYTLRTGRATPDHSMGEQKLTHLKQNTEL